MNFLDSIENLNLITTIVESESEKHCRQHFIFLCLKIRLCVRCLNNLHLNYWLHHDRGKKVGRTERPEGFLKLV
jgi:hypothetical protein